MNQAWFTTSQLCARLQMSAKEIKTMRERHGLPYMCAGKGYRYPVAGVIEWESERTFASPLVEVTARSREACRPRSRGPARRSTQWASGRNLLSAG